MAAARRAHETRAGSSQMTAAWLLWDGSGPLCAPGATGARAGPYVEGQSLGLRHQQTDGQTAWPHLPTSAPSSLSTLPPQWPAGLAPTSAESQASVCRARRGPTRTGTASSAARRAPAATGSAWPVPATYLSVEASRGPPCKEERGVGEQGKGPGASWSFVKLFAVSRACQDFHAAALTKCVADPQCMCQSAWR